FAAYPTIDLSRFINNLKTVSSRLVRKNYQEHLAKFYWEPVLWTRAYCLLSSGGAPIDVINQYIQNQGQ
ncbi:MAG: transposase, partial [Desulfobacteraceae bacterium]|nr:transposase [Desulfobacteraceae bacterium]